MSGQVEFPFDLLHIEIINYTKESEERRNAAKKEWEQVADTCVDAAQLDKYQSLVQLAFAHNSYVTQLEAMGYRVGYVMVEHVSKEAPKLISELEAVIARYLEFMFAGDFLVLCLLLNQVHCFSRTLRVSEMVKFICKEFWSAVFGKQVDNLRTNHKGIYVVQDNNFCTLRSLAEGQQFTRESGALLAFPCGVVTGALANLNINAEVSATVETLPVVKFSIHITQ
ncbi:transport protein particle component, Bet3 [Dictyocaulus viviparus]|uniref:Transport protein particle component, Bet3 n=1 Tax=Dictyocaulus viviparus TaxID=29172 RepID=A0A0D8XMN8_DICVI|nr:transport protein particle component, Bet3 [Dictyocaulus viviparus]